jgi:hypothetical protein
MTLLAIDYVFHVTAIVASVVVVGYFLVSLRDMRDPTA